MSPANFTCWSNLFNKLLNTVVAAGRQHLNASPFTLQTNASFLKISDTTSLCRSNFGCNVNICTSQTAPRFSAENSSFEKASECFLSLTRGSTLQLVSAQPWHHVTLGTSESNRAHTHTFKSTIFFFLLSSETYFIDMRKCHVVPLVAPPSSRITHR